MASSPWVTDGRLKPRVGERLPKVTEPIWAELQPKPKHKCRQNLENIPNSPGFLTQQRERERKGSIPLGLFNSRKNSNFFLCLAYMTELLDLMDCHFSSNLGDCGTPPPLLIMEGQSSEFLTFKHPKIHDVPGSRLLTISPNLAISIFVSSSHQRLGFFNRQVSSIWGEAFQNESGGGKGEKGEGIR